MFIVNYEKHAKAEVVTMTLTLWDSKQAIRPRIAKVARVTDLLHVVLF